MLSYQYTHHICFSIRFKLSFNSNIWPKSAPFRDIGLRNLSDLTLTFQDLSRSNVMVSFDSVYGFLLIYVVTTCLSLTV